MVDQIDLHRDFHSFGFDRCRDMGFTEIGVQEPPACGFVGFFLPGDSLLFIAGFLSSDAGGSVMPSLPWVLLCGFAAAVIGDQVGYLFGRKVGPALFAAVIPPEVRDRHVELLDARIAGLSDDASRSGSTEAVGGPATELLDWWIEHRLQVVVLLDRAEGTPYADEPAAFVRHLTEHAVRAIGEPVGDVHRRLLSIVFDNTRRAIAAILHSSADPGELRQLIAGFWCYQLPGLDGLMDWMSKTD